MPQLVSYYFVHQIIFGFGALSVFIYLSSHYILPRFLELYLVRSLLSRKINS